MTDTTPEAVAVMADALIHIDRGGCWQIKPKSQHPLCVEAAAMLTALSAKHQAELQRSDRWKATASGEAEAFRDMQASWEKACAERDQARADLAEAVGLMQDPVAVHVNMLRGSVARLLPSQVWHIYGEALVDEMPSDVRKAFLAKHT